MPNLSVMLTQTFIENFQYCDTSGRRSNTSTFMRYFLDDRLTIELERIANMAMADMRRLHELCLSDNQERTNDIYSIISTLVNEAWKLRLHFGYTSTIIKARDMNGKPLCTSTTTKPKKQSRFETELKKTIDAMTITADQSPYSAKNSSIYVDLRHAHSVLHDNARRVDRTLVAN